MTWIVAQQFQVDRFDAINVAAGGTGHQMMTSGDKEQAPLLLLAELFLLLFYRFIHSLL